ncbi:MAG: RNA polymerase sigma factor [Bacteroidales bacterium]|nr:RNA polymerase sigma factor [Bacteroidales bacterium]
MAIYIEEILKSIDDITEAELASLCAKGDRSAMRVLYNKYATRLTILIYRYVGDYQEAKDLMHDTMIEVFNSIGRYHHRNEGGLYSWISSVAIHTTIDWIRKQGKLKLTNLEEKEYSSETNIAEITDISIQVLEKCINQIPVTKRIILNLYCIEGFSHKQIAEQLGISEKASSSMLAKAKKILASKLEEYSKKQGR